MYRILLTINDFVMGRGSGGVRITNNNNDAIRDYVSGDAMYINNILRREGELDDYEKSLVRDLDRATNKEIKENILYRSVDAEAIFGKLDDSQFENLVDRVVWNDKQPLIVRNTEPILKRASNITITEKGFMSTSKDKNVVDNWGDFSGAKHPIVLKIQTNGKAKGFDVSKSKYEVQGDEQNEVILRRNLKYKVEKIYGENNNIYVDVTLI